MNTLLKNTFIYTLGNLLPQLIAFILLPVYTKYLSPAEYGITNAMMVVQALSTVFFTFALDRSIIRLYWDYNDSEKKEFLGTIFICMNILSISFIIITFVFHSIINLLFKEIEFYPFFVFTILMTYFINFSIIPKNYFRLQNMAGKFFIISIIEIIINTSLVLFFVVVLQEKALGVVKGKFYASLILLPIFGFITFKTIRFKINFPVLKESLKFSLPILPSIFSAWVLGQADRVFIASNLSYSDLGIYSLSQRLGSIIGMISGAFTMAYHPIFFKVANKEFFDDKSRDQLYKYNNSFIIILMFFGYGIALFSKEFIQLFLNSKYHMSYIYVPPIIFAALISSISSAVLGAFFQQSKKMKQDMIYAVVAACITLVSYIFLIKYFGLYGALLLTVLNSTILFTMLYTYAKKHCFFIEFNWKEIARIGFVIISTVIILNYLVDFSLVISLSIKALVYISLLSYVAYQNKNFILRLFNKD